MNETERFGFFDGDGELYEYGQEDLILFFANAFTDGIRVEDDGKMSFEPKMENGKLVIGKGYAVLNGCFYALKTNKTIEISKPLSFQQIFRVVIQLDYNQRKIGIVLKEGVAGSSPTAPEILKNELFHELSLCQIRISADGSIVLTDERYREDICGGYRPRNNTAFESWFNAAQESLDSWFKTQQGTGWTQMFTTTTEPVEAVAGAHWFAPLNFK